MPIEWCGGNKEYVLFLDPCEMRLRNLVVELTHGVVVTQGYRRGLYSHDLLHTLNTWWDY